MRVGFYARVSTHDQQTLGLQTEAMRAYANQQVGDRPASGDREDFGPTDLGRAGVIALAQRRPWSTSDGKPSGSSRMTMDDKPIHF